jgi:quinolinate synthase
MSKKNTTTLVEVTVTSQAQKTTTVDDVRKMCQKIGDSLSSTYANTGDIKAAAGAISAYGTAIGAVKAQLIYKKMTSSPARIEFFETN